MDQTRLRALEVQRRTCRSSFSDDYPDIRKVPPEMAELKKLVGKSDGSVSWRQATKLKAELAQKQGNTRMSTRMSKSSTTRLPVWSKNLKKAADIQPVIEPENPLISFLRAQIKARPMK
jgi:hypothetical protein